MRPLFLCLVLLFLLPVSLVSPGARSHAAQSSSYPETTAGLKSFLQQLSDLADTDDSAKASTLFRQLELPDPGRWFYDLLGPDLAKRVTVAYAVNPIGREEEPRKAARHRQVPRS